VHKWLTTDEDQYTQSYGLQIWQACSQGQSGHDPFFEKGSWSASCYPLNFWALNANCSNMVNGADFRFGVRVLRDSRDTTPYKIFEKGAWPVTWPIKFSWRIYAVCERLLVEHALNCVCLLCSAIPLLYSLLLAAVHGLASNISLYQNAECFVSFSLISASWKSFVSVYILNYREHRVKTSQTTSYSTTATDCSQCLSS